MFPAVPPITAALGVRNRSRRRRLTRGFSLVELLVVMFILVVLIALLLPVLTRVRKSANSVNCVSNLRQIAVAFQQYASGNRGRLPDPLASDMSWEAAIL